MRSLTRLALAALMLNLSLTGREVACEHENQAAAAPAASHDHGQRSDPAPPRPDDQDERCDDAGAMCCEAIASCSVSGVPERSASESTRHFFAGAVLGARNIEPNSAAPEVATPPPRRV